MSRAMLFLFALSLCCGSVTAVPTDDGGSGGVGGKIDTERGTGGASATGGTMQATGGNGAGGLAAGTGGIRATGGLGGAITGTGGFPATGGVGAGGNHGTGGIASTGGTSAGTGGVAGKGAGTGGTTSTGGASGVGGAPMQGTGGETGSGQDGGALQIPMCPEGFDVTNVYAGSINTHVTVQGTTYTCAACSCGLTACTGWDIHRACWTTFTPIGLKTVDVACQLQSTLPCQ